MPSSEHFDDISKNNGITKSLMAGADAFGRVMNHEQK